MINDERKKLTCLLESTSEKFILDNFKEEDGLFDLLSILISCHISSLFRLFTKIGKQDEEAKIITDRIINDIEKLFSQLSIIKTVKREQR
jgi:hypothetical protein